MRIRISRLFYLFVLPNLIFGIIALALPGETMVQVMNGAMVALATGVCVAYGSVLRQILTDRHREIDRADILALGIFCGWFAISLRAIWSIVWRHNGLPLDWVDSQLVGYMLYLGVCAAAFHLLAPGAVGDRIPSREWVKVGALCAIGVMSIFVASWLLNAFPLSAG